jgi:16S rRNA processing protein RimM
VPEISVQGGFVRIDPVAAGLADEDDDAEAGVDRRPRGPKDAGGNR